MKGSAQAFALESQHDARALDDTRETFDFRGPWFDSRTAAAYIPCKSVKAFYEWCRSHFIVRRSNGSVAKADLDRALKAKRPKRVMSPNSLANLRKRSARVHDAAMMREAITSSVVLKNDSEERE